MSRWLLPAVVLYSIASSLVRSARGARVLWGRSRAESATGRTHAAELRRWLYACSRLVAGIAVLSQLGLEFDWSAAAQDTAPVSAARGAGRVAGALAKLAPALERSAVGVIAGVIADGETQLASFGSVALRELDAPRSDTAFEIGSISKVFTGILLASAQQRGELAPDTPLAEVLPEAAAIPALRDGEPITLEQLSSHSSGLPRLPPGFFGPGRLLHAALHRDPYRGYSDAELRSALARVELDAAPGSEYAYSNWGAGLLGLALTRAAHSDSYAELVRRRICEPLGMVHTGMASSPGVEEPAAGYRALLQLGPLRVGMRAQLWEMPENLAGAGALRSSADDMLRFLAANMRPDSDPLGAVLRAAQQPRRQLRPGRSIGMAWQRTQLPELESEVIWHNGSTGGYRSFLGFTADGRFGVVLLANTVTEELDTAGFDLLVDLAGAGSARTE